MKVLILAIAIIGCVLSSTIKTRQINLRNHIRNNKVFQKEVGNPHYKIVNGHEARPHSIPYQAYIIVNNLNGDSWNCGGVLITENYVLTAAHCIDGASEASVYLGVHDLTMFEHGSVEINSRKLIIHEFYNSTAIDNDIGLIELDGEVYPSISVDYAKLPSIRDGPHSLVDLDARISGWGLIDGITGNSSKVLLEAYNTVVPNLQCNAIYQTIRDEEICLKSDHGGTACFGDDGGPVVIGNIVEGILSYDFIYCGRDYPVVAVRLRSFLNWIERHSDWVSD